MKTLKSIAIVSVCAVAVGNTFGADAQAREKKSPSVQSTPLSDPVLFDKIHGSLLGKCIGLVLGQPVEGWAKPTIKEKATAVGNYPVEYYFPGNFDTTFDEFLLGNFDSYPPNDDTSLMTMSFIVLREHGIDFTSRQLAETWAKHMNSACTAEEVGLDNFKQGVWPPESAIKNNPYGQWIGAQMRAEIWGMIAPGLPQVAAEYAKRDAMITHVRNGIYGEQYMAAAVSLAMVNTDLRMVLEQALATIPAQSDYARAVKEIFACYDRGDSWEEAWQHIDDHYGWNDDGTRTGDFENPEYNTKKGRYVWGNIRWVHVIPNGAACVLALLYGEGDFSESICIATMCGYDADCNAGTVGGIIGAMIGEKAISNKWKAPLNNRFKTGVHQHFPAELKINEMAREITGFAKDTLERDGLK